MPIYGDASKPELDLQCLFQDAGGLRKTVPSTAKWTQGSLPYRFAGKAKRGREKEEMATVGGRE